MKRVCAIVGCFGFVLLLAASCGGEGSVGDPCDTPGSTEECVDGAVCDAADEGPTCLELCVEQEDCVEGESCNGVSGTNLKACHPDDGA